MSIHEEERSIPASGAPARQAQDRLAFMVEAGNLLATSIELETTLRNVARLAVPRLADWCGIFRAEDDGSVTQLVVAHKDVARQELLEVLQKNYPPDLENPHGYRSVIRTGVPELIPTIPHELIVASARDAEHRRLLEELGLLSMITVPLFVEEKTWGAITLATDESSGRHLGQADLTLATELATRAAITIRMALLMREVAEGRRLFKSTLSSIGDAVIACDCDGSVTFINSAAERLTACPAETACGGAAALFLSIETGGEDHPIDELIARVITLREESELPPDAVVIARDGARAPVSGGVSPIVDAEQGTIAGVVIVLHDVTAIKESQLALSESRERFRLVSDSVSSHAIITVTPDGVVDSWNTGAEHIFGYTTDEILGLNVRILFTPEDQALGISELEMRQAEATGRANDDRWMMRRNQVRFFANGMTTPLRDERGRLGGFVKVLRDNTEQRLLHEEIERARARAEQASQAKSHFLATLSHELRTPLTPVLTAVQVLSDDPGISEENRGLLAMMARNIEIEARLIDDLLDVTRITSGKLQVQLETVDAHEVVLGALEICRDQVEHKSQTMRIALDAEEHHVHGDAARLQQVFWNLLTNAVKFTPIGGAITISSCNENDRLCVSITDTGIGIERDLLSKVFTVFEQGDVSVTKRFGGLGLGLSISRAIAEVHGGSIRAESPGRGAGTTFIVELPTVPAAAAPDARSNGGG